MITQDSVYYGEYDDQPLNVYNSPKPLDYDGAIHLGKASFGNFLKEKCLSKHKHPLSKYSKDECSIPK